MLRRHRLVDAFEDEQIRRRAPNYFENLRIVEALYDEARSLGVLPPSDPLEGIDDDIRLRAALNVQRDPRANRDRS